MDPDPEEDRDSEEVVEIIEIDDTEPLSDDDEVVGDDGKMIWKFSVWYHRMKNIFKRGSAVSLSISIMF